MNCVKFISGIFPKVTTIGDSSTGQFLFYGSHVPLLNNIYTPKLTTIGASPSINENNFKVPINGCSITVDSSLQTVNIRTAVMTYVDNS